MNADSLFRVSLKAVMLDEQNRVLVVKESGRTSWDLPGGGMEHGETVGEALARELHEEVGLTGEFDYEVIGIDDPHVLAGRDIYQIRLVIHVMPANAPRGKGSDADEAQFIDPVTLKDSEKIVERLVYKHWKSLREH